jgi:DegV family protein with EDD domain
MKICISAESTIDLSQELLDKYNIKTTPFGINFNNELVEDKIGIGKEIFEYVNNTKTLPKTSAVPPEQFQKHFEKIKKEYDAIIHISLSSNLSCAYNNAKLVASEMENVYVVDSKTLSTGIALLAIKAKEMADKGLSPEKIVQELESLKNELNVSFVIEKLTYLHKGGRCSALTLLGANILKIKPQINVTNGKMGVGKKFIGNTQKVISKYCEELLSENPNPDLSTVFVTHSSPMPEAEEFIEAKLKEKGFKQVYNTYAGGTISSHCGENCIGILFINK